MWAKSEPLWLTIWRRNMNMRITLLSWPWNLAPRKYYVNERTNFELFYHFLLFFYVYQKFGKNLSFNCLRVSIILPVMQATSTVEVLFFCRNRFGFNPGKCFSRVDCVSGLKGVRAPHDDADNIECSYLGGIKYC